MSTWDSRVALALDEALNRLEALLPLGFERVPPPILNPLQSLTPRLFKLPSPEGCPLPTHPVAEQEVLLAVLVRDPCVSLALDEPR